MKNQKTPPNSLRMIHKVNHAATLKIAKRLRHDGATHAQLMELAKSSRFYFEQLRGID